MAGSDSANLLAQTEQTEGLKLEDYSQKLGVSEAEVWRRLNAGELVGRAAGGNVRVFHSPEAAQSAFDADIDPAGLPPLPETSKDLVRTADRSTEVALLLDHLSLAKEENKEILRMAQESIRKVSELSDSLMQSKNLLIASHEQEIALLREKLHHKDAEIRELKRKQENLEMLAEAALLPTSR